MQGRERCRNIQYSLFLSLPRSRRGKNIVRVLGLDAIDGTPIVDIKPYLPAYDSVPEATVPEWVSRALQDTLDNDESS